MKKTILSSLIAFNVLGGSIGGTAYAEENPLTNSMEQPLTSEEQAFIEEGIKNPGIVETLPAEDSSSSVALKTIFLDTSDTSQWMTLQAGAPAGGSTCPTKTTYASKKISNDTLYLYGFSFGAPLTAAGTLKIAVSKWLAVPATAVALGIEGSTLINAAKGNKGINVSTRTYQSWWQPNTWTPKSCWRSVIVTNVVGYK